MSLTVGAAEHCSLATARKRTFFFYVVRAAVFKTVTQRREEVRIKRSRQDTNKVSNEKKTNQRKQDSCIAAC